MICPQGHQHCIWNIDQANPVKSALIQSVKLALAISLWIRARFGWFLLINKLLNSFFRSTSMLWCKCLKTDVFPTLSISYVHVITSKPHLKQGHDGGYSFEHNIPRFPHGFEGFSWINFFVTKLCNRFCFHYKSCGIKTPWDDVSSLWQHKVESVR